MSQLLDAFRNFGAVSPEAPARQRQAVQAYAETLFAGAKAATASMGRFGFGDEERVSCISLVLQRLYTSGPRGIREGDPDDDERVAKYLFNAVRNGLRDASAKRSRQRKMLSLDDLPPNRALQQEDRDSAADERDEARRVVVERLAALVFDDIVPTVAAARAAKSVTAGQEFTALVGLLRQEVARESSVQAIAMQRVRSAPLLLTPAIVNRLYESGHALDEAAVATLAAEGVVVTGVVGRPLPRGSVPKPDELLDLVHSAAVEVERVNLDTRFKNYRAAILAEVERRVEAGELSFEEAAMARQVVRHSLQFMQKTTDRAVGGRRGTT